MSACLNESRYNITFHAAANHLPEFLERLAQTNMTTQSSVFFAYFLRQFLKMKCSSTVMATPFIRLSQTMIATALINSLLESLFYLILGKVSLISMCHPARNINIQRRKLFSHHQLLFMVPKISAFLSFQLHSCFVIQVNYNFTNS